jgi:cysteinyl-tRNA synthetase
VHLYSSLSRQLEPLPEAPAPIGIYFCGPTVYQRIHVGNARAFIVAMWLRRYLASRGYQPKLVINVTDVNDKIYAAAKEAGMESAKLAELATGWYVEDTDALGLGRPDVEPRVSTSIGEIISLTKELVERDMAYESQGDVYFRAGAYPDYGQLSHQRSEEMRNEEEPNELKEDPRDFALWKAAKTGEDETWESPWGRGRPGWHIECSAMAERELGPSFDIHGGGLDLIFPHHENELAQSRAAGRDFAGIWMHNGILRLVSEVDKEAEKMSKSLGNVALLRDVLAKWGRETVLLYFLTGHWSKPIDYSDALLEQARAQTETLRNFLRSTPSDGVPDHERLFAVLDDDFSTPALLELIHEWRRQGDASSVRFALEVFGLGSLAVGEDAPAEVVALADSRQRVREAKDWAESDRLREEIRALGWEPRDEPGGYSLVPRA